MLPCRTQQGLLLNRVSGKPCKREQENREELFLSDVALLIREQLPFLFASTIDQNRGNKATLFRSPDRVIGFAGATRQISRTRTFGLSEAMAFADVKDSRFVLLTCLLLGLVVWWYLLPEPLLVQPTACCSPECASLRKPHNAK